MVQWQILNHSPFVTPRQVLGYLVLAIAPFFVSVTRSKRSQNYSVSESQGAPKAFGHF